MKFFRGIFKKKKAGKVEKQKQNRKAEENGKAEENTKAEQNSTADQNDNVMRLRKLHEYMNDILESDRYLARSDYKDEILRYKDVMDIFMALKSSDMLPSFCKKNKVKLLQIEESIELYSNFEDHVDRHNEAFISNRMLTEKEYLDNILKNSRSENCIRRRSAPRDINGRRLLPGDCRRRGRKDNNGCCEGKVPRGKKTD